jgi:hypothetical protein
MPTDAGVVVATAKLRQKKAVDDARRRVAVLTAVKPL